MKKGWRIIGAIVLTVLLLGAVAVFVGFVTGADWDRVYSVLDNRYNITMYWEYVVLVVETVLTAW